MKMTEKTLFMVKPDAVARSLTGSIISRFEQKGFKITNLKMFRFTKKQAERFYAVHSEKPFFGELTSFVCSGPVVAAIIEGDHAVSTVRIMIGDTKSFEAEPGSIRGDYGLGFTDNIIHASDSESSFEHESDVIFGSGVHDSN